MNLWKTALMVSAAAWVGCAETGPVRFMPQEDAGPARDGGFDASGDTGPCVTGALYCEGNTRYLCAPGGEATERVACTGATFEHDRIAAPASAHDDAVNLGHAERLLPVLASHAPERRGA